MYLSYVQGIYSLTRLFGIFQTVMIITRSKIGTEAKFGGSVAFTIWGEQPAIETTTSIDISDRNRVVHA